MTRSELEKALWEDRRATKNRGHDWDVADVMGVLDRSGILQEVDGQNLAA